MLHFITKQHKIIFAAGAATGVAILGLLKTKKVRDMAVKSVAGTIMLKDKVLETACNIKEEADDIVCEARAVALKGCSCEDSCEDEACDCGDDCECK